MQLACLPPGTDASRLERVVAAAPEARGLLIPTADHPEGDRWTRALALLRRELYLRPELQVLATVAAGQVDRARRQVARSLVEGGCGDCLIAAVEGDDVRRRIAGWIAEGHELPHRATGQPLPLAVSVLGARVQWGAAAWVEACACGAQVVLGPVPAAGALTVAALYESLQLTPRDWDRLAAVATVGRVIESPEPLPPLWAEVAGDGTVGWGGTSDIEALRARLAVEAHRLTADLPQPDVELDLTSAQVVAPAPARWQPTGVRGGPPTGHYALDIHLRVSNSAKQQTWPTTIPKTEVDWDVTIKRAADWQ